MNGLNTLVAMNNKKLVEYMEKKPLVKVEKAEDVTTAPDYSGIDMKDLINITGMEEIETCFVDSSGFGGRNEPAMCVEDLYKKVEKIISENENVYACLTGIGQFQVYCTLLRKL